MKGSTRVPCSVPMVTEVSSRRLRVAVSRSVCRKPLSDKPSKASACSSSREPTACRMSASAARSSSSNKAAIYAFQKARTGSGISAFSLIQPCSLSKSSGSRCRCSGMVMSNGPTALGTRRMRPRSSSSTSTFFMEPPRSATSLIRLFRVATSLTVRGSGNGVVVGIGVAGRRGRCNPGS